jgi:hypothetical protein
MDKSNIRYLGTDSDRIEHRLHRLNFEIALSDKNAQLISYSLEDEIALLTLQPTTITGITMPKGVVTYCSGTRRHLKLDCGLYVLRVDLDPWTTRSLDSLKEYLNGPRITPAGAMSDYANPRTRPK